MNSEQGSITIGFQKLAAGDDAAAQKLWEHYYHELTVLTRSYLQQIGSRRREHDEEDAVVTAFTALVQGAQQGRYPDVDNRDDLRSLLVTMVLNKARNLKRQESAAKRGGNQVRGESVFGSAEGSIAEGLDAAQPLPGRSVTPPPEAAAALAQTLQQILEQIEATCSADRAAALRRLLELKLAGHTNAEIASTMQCVERTVERKLNLIRQLMEKAAE